MSDKGDPIKFTKGKYVGKTGWKNKEKGSTRERLYVIVDLGNDVLKRTWVKKSSAKSRTQATPTSFAEAVLQQCPDVEEKLDSLCAELAMCNIGRDPNGLVAIMYATLNEACHTQNRKRRALYRSVVYEEDVQGMEQGDV